MTRPLEPLRQCLRTPWGKLACWGGIFAGLAVIDAAQLFTAQRFENYSITWGLAFRRAAESNIIMAVLGLGVLWLARRFPHERGRTGRWLGFHVVASCGFALAYSAAYAAVLDGQMSVKGEPFVFARTFQKVVIFYSHVNMAIYWMILLGHDGWHYYKRYRDRERRAAELEGQLVRARLDALRMQLNPHFLFNTLNTIAALIHERPEAADRTLTRLGELLRLSLDRSDAQEIPLAQEINFLEHYLEIERARFGDRLDVELDIADDTRSALVPSLLLQPIVENALKHGIEPRVAAGRILIRARRGESQLELTVRDNGSGLPDHPATPVREGIGLSNTRSRLAHLYGESQSLTLQGAADGGLEVRIHLPFRSASDPGSEPEDATKARGGASAGDLRRRGEEAGGHRQPTAD